MGVARNRIAVSETAAAEGRRLSLIVRKAKVARRAAELAPIIDEIRATGARTLRDIAAGLNARDVPTARGGLWSSAQVFRVLALLD